MQSLLESLDLSSRYVLMASVYYAFVAYPIIWVLRRRRRA